MTVFVDTSALYAVLAQNDPHHAEATHLLQWCLEHEDVVTTNYVVVETAQLVRRRLGAAAAVDLLDRLLPSITTIWITESTHRAAVEGLRAANGNASLVDHASFAVMRASGIDHALAFDRDFERQGFSLPKVDDRLSGHQLSESRARYESSRESDDLVSVTELAVRAGRSINTVQSWRRRRPDFPTPVAELAAGPIWRWPEVAAWVRARQPARRLGMLRGRIHPEADWDSPAVNEEIARSFGA
jgi:predicted nucleic acid-binding protein